MALELVTNGLGLSYELGLCSCCVKGSWSRMQVVWPLNTFYNLL